MSKRLLKFWFWSFVFFFEMWGIDTFLKLGFNMSQTIKIDISNDVTENVMQDKMIHHRWHFHGKFELTLQQLHVAINLCNPKIMKTMKTRTARSFKKLHTFITCLLSLTLIDWIF